MVKKYFFILIFFLLSSSCSFLSDKVESLATEAETDTQNKSARPIKTNIFCEENNNLQLLLEDDSAFKFYKPLFVNLFESKSFSFIQKAALLSMSEMNRRPDNSSPSARLQYFLHYNKKDYYFDFHAKDLKDNSKMPFIKGLDVLLKTFDKSKNLSTLAEILDKNLPNNINVSPILENFLQSNTSNLMGNIALSETFIKGDMALTKHESFKRNNLKKILNSFNSKNIANDEFYESNKNSLETMDSSEPDQDLKCNFKINQKNSLKEDFLFTDQRKSHYFALKEGDNFFIAISASVIQKPFKNFESTYFFKSIAPPLPLPVCQFKNLKKNIILISSSGRNPAQHLKHLIAYELNSVNSFHTLGNLLKFSRHLTLSNPDRILYESKRGRKSQLDFFLSMNFPIYHVDVLGDIIGFGSFENDEREQKSLVADERSKARLWCNP